MRRLLPSAALLLVWLSSSTSLTAANERLQNAASAFLRQQANRRHIMEKKPTKRTRRLDGRTDVAQADVPRVKRLLGL